MHPAEGLCTSSCGVRRIANRLDKCPLQLQEERLNVVRYLLCEHGQDRGLDTGRIGRRLCCDVDERTGERDDERLDG